MRFAQTQVWPAFRYFDAIAPLTAISISASSKTMNGALPPNSIEVFLTVAAHCSISNLPTSVEPVKVNLPPISFDGPVTQEKTPFGTPARSPNSHKASAENGVPVAGFKHHRAPGGQGRAAFAGDHRRREIPRRDRGADADRLLGHDDALVGGVRRDRVAVDALAFLAEPFDERRGIGDLAARLGQGLALLGGHQRRQIL